MTIDEPPKGKLIDNTSAIIKAVADSAAGVSIVVADGDVFVQALLDPPKPVDKLLKAAKKYKTDVVSNRYGRNDTR
jgi:hypothetical protein